MKQYYEALFFIIQTADRMQYLQYFTILQYNLYWLNIQDDRSTRGLLAKPFKKTSKINLYGQPVVIFAVWAVGRVLEWTLMTDLSRAKRAQRSTMGKKMW